MIFPKHVTMHITHNPHLAYYMTVEEYLGELSGINMHEDRERMIATGEIWEIQWYPTTPIGSYTVCAATLGRALELANEGCS